jgi:hypothetical protein
METLVRTGLWGLFTRQSGNVDRLMEKRLIPLLFTGEGNMVKIKDRLLEVARSTPLYTIQLSSLTKPLAIELHKRLEARTDYLGFVQVLPTLLLHQEVFGFYSPRYQIERKKIFVLYSSFAEDEWFADEIIEWWKGKYTSIGDMPFISSLSKRDVEMKFTTYDASEGPASEYTVHNAIRVLADLWEAHAEQTLYALQDRVPDALDELFAAIEIAKKPVLSSADGAQIAVNLRRTLEHITRYVSPPDKEKSGWVVRQWENFIEGRKQELGAYGEVIKAEAIGLADMLERLKTLYRMENKGVHEDIEAKIFCRILLRLVLLANEAIALQSGRRAVKLERGFFTQILYDD